MQRVTRNRSSGLITQRSQVRILPPLILRELGRQKGIELVEGIAASDHIRMLLRVSPKYNVAMTVVYLKGSSAIRIHRELTRTRGTLSG